MRLVLVELTRLRSRRAIVLLVVLAALLAGALAGGIAWDTRPLTATDRRDAAAQAELEGQRSEIRQEVQACRSDPTAYLGPNTTALDCADALVPTEEAYYPRDPLNLGRALGTEGLHLALVVVGLMVVAGCTFAGADWSSGAMSTQLLFRPGRLQVWWAKAAAITAGSAVVAAVVLGGFWLVLWAVATSRGIDVPREAFTRLGWHLLRSVVLAMAAGLGGFALTMVFRHTVTTLALLFVYAVGGEVVTSLVPVEGAGRWAIGNNVFGWLATNHRYFDASISCAPGERCTSIQTITHLEAGAFLAALLLVATVISLMVFSRRDV